VEKRKPTANPTASMTASWTTFVTPSASVRPVTTAERDMGRERKRSISPFFRSSESPRAVTKPPKVIDCTMIPGIRKST
jgi:hypothetical protein